MRTIGFVVNTFCDTESLCRCLSSVRDHYPDAPLTVIDDGGLDADLGLPVSVYKANLIRGGHMRPLTGAWIHRWLQAGLAMNTDVIVKLDPDSRVHRPFRHIPVGPAFGYPLDCWYGKYLHGGCKGYTRGCAERLVLDLLVRRVDAQLDKATARKLRGQKHALSEDLVLSWVLTTEDIPQVPWGEVAPVPMSPQRGYAVSHGHPSPAGGARDLKL